MPPFEFTTGELIGGLFNAETGEKIMNLSVFEIPEISVGDPDAIEDPCENVEFSKTKRSKKYKLFPKEISFTCENVEFFPKTKRSKRCKLFKKLFGINALHWIFPKKKDRRAKRLKRRIKNG